MKGKNRVALAAASVISWLLAGLSTHAPVDLHEVHAAPPLPAGHQGPPLSFVPNVGQLDPDVRFVARGAGYKASMTETEVVLTLGRGEPSPEFDSVRVRFASPFRPGQPEQIAGLDRLPGVVNVYRGNDPARWRRGIPTYARVRYYAVYPGIDAVFYGNPQKLELDYVVAPGADPSAIRLGFEGGDLLELDEQGRLSIHTAVGPVHLSKPVVYQQRDSGRHPIDGRYVLAGPTEVAFRLGEYDRTLPLLIDPSVLLPFPTLSDGTLSVSGYLPSGDNVVVSGGAVDDAGNFFIAGTTRADDVGTDAPPHPGRGAGEDLVVVKIDATGSTVDWSTYLGGENRDAAGAIALDPNGSVVVVGTSDSPDFPIAGEPAQPVKSGNDDAVVARLGGSGELLASTFLGGSGSDPSAGVALDGAGGVYIAGATTSGNFPVTPGAFQVNFGGAIDAYVSELAPGLDTVQYATFIGGGSTDAPTGIAVGDDGSAHIAGNTISGNFPTRNPAQAANLGFQDAFVTKLDPGGSNLVFSTYLGGLGAERALDITVDPATGDALIVGDTRSAAPFPRDGIVPDSAPDETDGFFARYDPNGLLAFLEAAGGTGPDSLRAVDIDPATGDILLAGESASTDLALVDSLQARLNSSGMGVEPFPGAGVLSGYVELPRDNETFPTAVTSADVDGNGQSDAVYLFDGTGGGPRVRIFPAPAGTGIDKVVEVEVSGGADVAAVRGDVANRNDLVVAGIDGLTLLRGLGDDIITSVTTLPGTAGVPFHRVVTGVIDGTTDELVVAARRVDDGPDSEVITYLDGSPVRVFPLSGPTSDLALDTSRDPQLVAAATRTSVSLFEGDALLQSFAFPPASLRGLALGDFNGDGVIDLFVTAPSSGRMLRGAGTGTFQVSPQTFPTGPAPRLPVSADFDGDSRLDVSFLGSDGSLVALMNRTPPGSSEAFLSPSSTPAGSFVYAAHSAAVIPRAGSTPAVAGAGVVAADLWYRLLTANVFQQGYLGSTGVDDLNAAFLGADGPGASSVAFIGQTQQRLPAGGFDFQAPLVAAFNRTADPRVPVLSINNPSVIEGGILSFVATLSEPTDRDVTAVYFTFDGSADALFDYEPVSGTLNILAGVTLYNIGVFVTDDATYEGNEDLRLTLRNARNATILLGEGVGTIVDDDPPPSASVADVSASEGDNGAKTVEVTVTLDAASGLLASFDYTTADGTATAGEDYDAASGTLTFEPGQTVRTIQAVYRGDAFFEPVETFTVVLSNPVDATIGRSTGTVTIFNDDVANLPTVTAEVQTPVVDEGGTASVLVTATADSNDSALTLTLRWGDGTPDETSTFPLSGGTGTATIAHVYADNDTFGGTVSVIDVAGQSASTGFTVTVNNVAPTVNAGPDRTVRAGQPLTVDGTIQDPGTNDSFTIEIDWDNDGVFDETITRPAGSTTFTATHVYDLPGTITAIYRGTDKDGGVGTDTVTFTVEAAPSGVVFFDPLGPTGTVLFFNPGRIAATRIAAAQTLFLILRRLCDLGLLGVCPLAEQVLDFLDALVPADARYALSAPDPGAGTVPATLTSRDANGSPIQTHEIVLGPSSAGRVESRPFVAVPRGGRIFSGGFGPLLFVAASPDGSLHAQAPPFGESFASVCLPFPLTAKRPLGSLVYDPSISGTIEAAGEEDCFGVKLDPGQTLTVQVLPDDAGLQPALELSGPNGATLAAKAAPSAGQASILQTVSVETPGTYQIDVSGFADTIGAYSTRIVLNAALEEETLGGGNDSIATAQDIQTFHRYFGDVNRDAVLGETDDLDFFRFSLDAGDRSTLALTELSGGPSDGDLDVALFDAGGNFIASSSPGGNVDRHISDFTAPASGTYYAQVTGDPGVPYNLIVMRNAAFDVERPQGQAVVPLAGNSVALGFLGGNSPSAVRDLYSLDLAGGQVLRAFTRTPADGPGQFENALNPRLRLRDGSGQVVATGAALDDGRNEELTFSVPAGGGDSFTIVLSAEDGSRGEYAIVLR